MLYFSGVKSDREFEQLSQGGASAILVDQFDLKNIPKTWRGKLALDSGAYYYHKKFNHCGISLALPEFRDKYVDLALTTEVEFRIAPDVFGSPDLTWFNWSVLERQGVAQHFTPVWCWDSNLEHLDYYLDRCPLIAIGGLVPVMRQGYAGDEFDKRIAESALKKLLKLCTKYPQRFHLLGCCWLKAMTQLMPYASMDTSKWLAGSRRGELIFRHTLGYLADRKPPDRLKMSSRDINIQNIKNLQAFSRLMLPRGEDAW